MCRQIKFYAFFSAIIWLQDILPAFKNRRLLFGCGLARRQRKRELMYFINSGWINSSILPVCLWESCSSFQGSSEITSRQNISKAAENACWSAVLARSKRASTGTGIVLWSLHYLVIVQGIATLLETENIRLERFMLHLPFERKDRTSPSLGVWGSYMNSSVCQNIQDILMMDFWSWLVRTHNVLDADGVPALHDG